MSAVWTGDAQCAAAPADTGSTHDDPRKRMDFKLSQDQVLVRDEARQLAREAFKDRAARWDRNAEVPWDNIRLLAEKGYPRRRKSIGCIGLRCVVVWFPVFTGTTCMCPCIAEG